MDYELVKRKVNELKADLDQPRKSFKQEDINLLAQTYQSQGIINPIEIDAENVIITGELRWRASKKANLDIIDCKLLKNITEKEKRERQLIENTFRIALNSKEREDAIKGLWDKRNEYGYNSEEELADIINVKRSTINYYLRAYKVRKDHDEKLTTNIASKTLMEIAPLPKTYQEQVLRKVKQGNLKADDVQETVKIIREVPNDIKKEILKPKSEITLEEAKEIAEFPKPEHRKQMIKETKRLKAVQKRDLQKKKELSQGKRTPQIKTQNIDEALLKRWRKIRDDVIIKMKKEFLEGISEQYKNELLKCVKTIQQYLISEFSTKGGIIT